MSKLHEIARQRREDVAALLRTTTAASLRSRALACASSSPALSLAERLREEPPRAFSVHVAAEFKRASPSKGDMATKESQDLDVQVAAYARAGASVVSVLTEPKWFKGSLQDMRSARQVVEAVQQEDARVRVRPLILRKDFVVHEAMVYEAREFGADTVLLIVAILEQEELVRLIAAARELGMEPLVEAANEAETVRALEAGARVIGINNRDLTTFVVDMETTNRCAAVVEKHAGKYPGVQIMALSGIKAREDVARYESLSSVRGVLVGEHLMRSPDPEKEIRLLVTNSASSAAASVLVKVCGVVRPDDALVSVRAGANLIGVIFAESPRRVSEDEARAVVTAVRSFRESTGALAVEMPSFPAELVESTESTGSGSGSSKAPGSPEKRTKAVGVDARKWYTAAADALRKTTRRGPLVVGVFMNQSVDEINAMVDRVGLDLVQLHGGEPWSACDAISVPVIKVVHVPAATEAEGVAADAVLARVQPHRNVVAVLLDTTVKGKAAGGTGQTFAWSVAKELGMPVIVAGGLTPANVAAAVAEAGHPLGVDCSSGVQAEGKPREKDHASVVEYVSKARKPLTSS